MDFFMVLSLLGGLALFLYGMHTMSVGLEHMAGGRLESLLRRMTDSVWKGILLGTMVTAVIQSSSATTVMVVGFVNAGILQLSQAVGIIMGANIGTTVTAWILSLTGLSGDSFWVQMLKPDNFSPIFAMVGIIFLMFMHSEKLKEIGSICVGFAILMFGMSTMQAAVEPLGEMEAFRNLLIAFSKYPLLGILAGTVLTAIIQSSSASVGILQALTATGSLTFGAAIPVLLGQNIGTCATALISCIGAGINAKRAARIHLYFNLIGTAIFMVLFYGIKLFVDMPFLDSKPTPMHIAMVHTTFNVMATLILAPFAGKLANIGRRRDALKGQATASAQPELESRLLATPSAALAQSRLAIAEMTRLARQNLFDSMDLVMQYNKKTATELQRREQQIDSYEDRLGTYLVQLSGRAPSESESLEISKMMRVLGDIERIGDHALHFCAIAGHKNRSAFSEAAKAELNVFFAALRDIVDRTANALLEDDAALAARVEPLEQVIDHLCETLKARHMERLRKGYCSADAGIAFLELLTGGARVSDHCSNIAVCVIRIHSAHLDSHDYLGRLKAQPDTKFSEEYAQALETYALPAYQTV